MSRTDGLTAQQHRVAELIADGHSDQAIAKLLHVERRTISFHVRRICTAWQIGAEQNARVEIAKHILKAA